MIIIGVYEARKGSRCTAAESRVANCESPYMVLVKRQTLLTGFPYLDVSRVWSETTMKYPEPFPLNWSCDPQPMSHGHYNMAR
jgi:hypothetical protein